jgi:protein-S-isoprenylcysteine O-methyltransferase Ste14
MPNLKAHALRLEDEIPAGTTAAGRTAALAYGIAVYALFLPTFLYAIGFVANAVVPKGIDSGSAGPVGTALLVNTLLLGLFAVQHMIMARQGFKRWWTRIVPQPVERSTFVLFTCVALILMYWLWQPMPGVVWSVEQAGLATALHVLSLAGWALVFVSTFLIDHFDLFGLKQVVRYATGQPHRDPAFKVVAVYRYVRHPLYLGFMVAFWATPHMTWGHLFFAAATTAFMLIAVRLEERDLKRAHAEYESYSARVPMILPRPGRKY